MPRTFLFALAVVKTGAMSVCGTVRAAPSPVVSIPSTMAGNMTDITGSGFPDGARVICQAEVTLSDGEQEWTVLGSVVADTHGHFSFVAIIPADDEAGSDPTRCSDNAQTVESTVLVIPLPDAVFDITPPGETTGQATALNDFGQATVTFPQGTYWGANYGTPRTAWAELPGPGSGIIGDAMNNTGAIGGCFNNSKTGHHDAGEWKAPFSKFWDLPGLGKPWYSINGLSNEDWAAGAGLGTGSLDIPVLWGPTGAPYRPPLLNGDTTGVANAMAGFRLGTMYDGFAVGTSGTNAVEWNFTAPQSTTRGGRPYSAPHFTVIKLPSLGGPLTEARAVNDTGIKAGDSQPTSSFSSHAVIWDAKNRVHDLGTLAKDTNSLANGVDDAGLVVGQSGITSPKPSAFVDARGKMFNLNHSIPSGSGWDLTTAIAVNQYGQIVGSGSLKGHSQTRAFLLNPKGLVAEVAAGPAVKGGGTQRHTSSLEFSPAGVTVDLGGTVEWNNNMASTVNVSDASGLGLFSRTLKRFMGFAYTFYAAGVYAYRDTLHPDQEGTVTVAPRSAPRSGFRTTDFQVYWASRSPGKGLGYDVQFKRPGSKSYVYWQRGATTQEGSFLPGSRGSGQYAFRARLRNLKTGKSSGWSPATMLTVG